MVSRLTLPLMLVVLWCALFATVHCDRLCPESNATLSIKEEVRKFLQNFDTWVKKKRPPYLRAAWGYESNVTDENMKEMLEAEKTYNEEIARAANKGIRFNDTYKNLCDNTMKREFEEVLSYSNKDVNNTEVKEIRNQIAETIAVMTGIYSKAKVKLHAYGKSYQKLEPGLTRILAESRNATMLLQAWKGWRDASGKKMRELYKKFVELNTNLTNLTESKHKDVGETWRAVYNSHHPEHFVTTVENLLKEIKPLYKQLHRFVWTRLKKIYGQKLFNSSLIPAHLLGNMWAQHWSTLRKDMMPFPNKTAVDVTGKLQAQNFTNKRMFETAEQFFKSLGLAEMPDAFWNRTIMARPDDGRDLICHASAWDFSDGKDFRIKMCTDINQEDLITIHHEMGHIEYYLQYKHLPFVFQNAANPGFHEAVGDTLALSAQTTKHLKTIGLLDKDFQDNNETDINYLMAIALDKIAFLPFAYVIDRWRWDVFSGNVTADNYNKHWWDLRCKYQGLGPPEERSEEDFDPGAKYHVATNVPYIRYFVSFVVQFQFYEALCNATNHTGPLYQCDFFNNTIAGNNFGQMLQLGSSVPWQDALENLTSSREMDMGSLKRYFEPLIYYLKEVNGNIDDWEDECEGVSASPSPVTDSQATQMTTSPGPSTIPVKPVTTSPRPWTNTMTTSFKQATTSFKPATNSSRPATTSPKPQTTTPSAASTVWKSGIVAMAIGGILLAAMVNF